MHITRCTRRITASHIDDYGIAVEGPGKASMFPNNQSPKPNFSGRKKRDTHYQQPAKVINPGKVIVMPPPGQAPKGYPQPGW